MNRPVLSILLLILVSCKTINMVNYVNKSFASIDKSEVEKSEEQKEDLKFKNELRKEVLNKMKISSMKFSQNDTLHIIESYNVLGGEICGMIKFNQKLLCYCKGRSKSDTILYFTKNIFSKKMTNMFINGQFDKLTPAFSTLYYSGITITKENELKYVYHKWQWWDE